jgi:hypothetical protein
MAGGGKYQKDLEGQLAFEGELTERQKHSMSRQHLRAARYFATRSQELEQDVDSTAEDQSIKPIHRSYVTGAIISAMAGLEASINELYLEARDNHRQRLQGLSDKAIALLAEWSGEIERSSMLLKYQTALLIAGAERFDKGAQPFQDIDSLVKLRNALIHYRPEWDSDLEVHQKLRDTLDSRFQVNPFYPDANLWFPHQCLGSGCANWAVEASETFLTEFCGRMGIPDRS